MGRAIRNNKNNKWSLIHIITKPQNKAIIQLLSDKKPRMPVQICKELSKSFPKATLYLAMKELAKRKFLVPMIIENKTKPWRSLTEILGYTLDEDLYAIIKTLDEVDEKAGRISNK
ncbi:MAG: hypothetical protein QXF56_02740 [Candidatus Micrarchaeia archaeon]